MFPQFTLYSLNDSSPHSSTYLKKIKNKKRRRRNEEQILVSVSGFKITVKTFTMLQINGFGWIHEQTVLPFKVDIIFNVYLYIYVCLSLFKSMASKDCLLILL